MTFATTADHIPDLWWCKSSSLIKILIVGYRSLLLLYSNNISWLSMSQPGRPQSTNMHRARRADGRRDFYWLYHLLDWHWAPARGHDRRRLSWCVFVTHLADSERSARLEEWGRGARCQSQTLAVLLNPPKWSQNSRQIHHFCICSPSTPMLSHY